MGWEEGKTVYGWCGESEWVEEREWVEENELVGLKWWLAVVVSGKGESELRRMRKSGVFGSGRRARNEVWEG